MRNFISMSVMLFGIWFPASQAWANTFSAMYVFGDSLSDVGANPSAVMGIYKLIGGCDRGHPCPPYHQGHFSNGQTAAEYMADAIIPGGTGGGNFYGFAVAGSTTGFGNFGDGGSQSGAGVFALPGMLQQIALYRGLYASVADDDALHMVWGGANDFLALGSPQTAAQNLVRYVDALASGGADYILVPNLPDLSLTPFVRASGVDAINAALGFSLDFNDTLAEQLSDLESLHPAAHIVPFDTFGLLNSIFADPSAYGFSNVVDACLSATAICADPDSYLFWDDFHPTTRLHAVFASAMLSQVPLPGAVVLFVSGLLFWMMPVRFVRKSAI